MSCCNHYLCHVKNTCLSWYCLILCWQRNR
nr:MAG TPA: hypothetical protein [Caudoviricetes sp.]